MANDELHYSINTHIWFLSWKSNVSYLLRRKRCADPHCHSDGLAGHPGVFSSNIWVILLYQMIDRTPSADAPDRATTVALLCIVSPLLVAVGNDSSGPAHRNTQPIGGHTATALNAPARWSVQSESRKEQRWPKLSQQAPIRDESGGGFASVHFVSVQISHSVSRVGSCWKTLVM